MPNKKYERYRPSNYNMKDQSSDIERNHYSYNMNINEERNQSSNRNEERNSIISQKLFEILKKSPDIVGKKSPDIVRKKSPDIVRKKSPDIVRTRNVVEKEKKNIPRPQKSEQLIKAEKCGIYIYDQYGKYKNKKEIISDMLLMLTYVKQLDKLSEYQKIKDKHKIFLTNTVGEIADIFEVEYSPDNYYEDLEELSSKVKKAIKSN